MTTSSRIRLGIAGLGTIAQTVHLPNLRTLEDRFDVRHVCDVSGGLAASIAAELPGDVTTSTDWHDLCTDESLDAVLLLTPGAHAEPALAALRAGKHVLAEKPLCVTQAEAAELTATAAEAGRVLQVAYMKMYDPVLPRARASLAGLGALRVVRITVLHPNDECQVEHALIRRFPVPGTAPVPGTGPIAAADLIAAADRYAAARTAEALGATAPAGLAALYNNVLLGSVVHELSLLRGLGFAPPTSYRYADARPLAVEQPAASAPCLLAVGDLGEGVELQLAWNWLPDYPEYTEELAVFGEAGRLYLDMPGPYLPAHRARLRVERASGDERAATTYHSSYITAFVHELAAFADSVQHGAPVLSDAAGAEIDTRSLQAMTAAIAGGAGIKLGGEAGYGRETGHDSTEAGHGGETGQRDTGTR
jgi:predicted dehydrogenase